MSNAFNALSESDEGGELKDGKAKWKLHFAAKIAKKGTKFGAASAVNHFTFGVAGAIFEAPAAYSTYQHLQALRALYASQPACTCPVETPYRNCSAKLDYIISQKERKLKNVARSMIPFLATINSAKNIVHHYAKDDQGQSRENHAQEAWENARKGCQKAKDILAELLGGRARQDAKNAVDALIDLDNGWEWVKEKMSAT